MYPRADTWYTRCGVDALCVAATQVLYRLEAPCQRPQGSVLLSHRFHFANHTLTLVWGTKQAQEHDEQLRQRALKQAEQEEEDRRIQLVNDAMFEIDVSSGDD